MVDWGDIILRSMLTRFLNYVTQNFEVTKVVSTIYEDGFELFLQTPKAEELDKNFKTALQIAQETEEVKNE